MRLTAWEEERLLIFSAAELARRRRARGVALNHPEAVALICDAMLEAARDGGTYAAVEAAGRAAVRADEVIPGVRELLDEIRLEVAMGDGTRLVVLLDPLGATASEPPDPDGPGAVRLAAAAPGADRPPGPRDDSPEAGRTAGEVREVVIRNESRRAVRVSSHYPIERVNPRLAFDREGLAGFRLDLPSGDSLRWAPGETRTVRLVRYGGRGAP